MIMAKRSGVQYKIDWINNRLDYYERNGMANFRAHADMEKVADSITWLWKWRHIDRATMEQMCDRTTAIFERG